MGMAKYFEDNIDIIIERQRNKSNNKGNSNLNILDDESTAQNLKQSAKSVESKGMSTSEHSKISDQKASYQISQSQKTSIKKIPDKKSHRKKRTSTQKKVYKDKILICQRCGQKFLFSANAQRQFDRKGWSEPKRCKSCRDFMNASYLMRHQR